MRKILITVAFMTLENCLLAGQVIPNPCIKATANCQFEVTTPGGISFTLLTPKTSGGYISFQAPNGGQTKPMLINYLYDSTFYLDCPDILEQLRPDPPGSDTDSTFIDLSTHQIINFVSNVFAVNCTKRAVAYENDTVSDGSVFVSPLNHLHQVIRIDSQVQVDNFGEIRREDSHFNPDGSLFVTYMLSDYSYNPPTYTKTTVTIPINYKGFVHSDAIDHSMSETWTPTVGNGNEP